MTYHDRGQSDSHTSKMRLIHQRLYMFAYAGKKSIFTAAMMARDLRLPKGEAGGHSGRPLSAAAARLAGPAARVVPVRAVPGGLLDEKTSRAPTLVYRPW